jgi:hypothetical protein
MSGFVTETRWFNFITRIEIVFLNPRPPEAVHEPGFVN